MTAPYTVAGSDEFLIAWTADQLGTDPNLLMPGRATGVVLDDRLVGACVWHDYRVLERGAAMQGSFASVSPRWITRRVLGEMFAYPFAQLGVTRLWGIAARSNKKARSFNERLGFRFESMARRAWDGEEDAAIYSMLPEECRWLKYWRRDDGESRASASA